VLLDTATFLWICRQPTKLSRRAAAIYEDPSNETFLSPASAYEIVLRCNQGRLDVGGSPTSFIRSERERRRIRPLPIDEESTFAVERLPAIHRDPFDRLLIGQSIAHGLTILTPDATIALYPIRTVW
jgi:PIN domain nuclease of toxin-antitoxin system